MSESTTFEHPLNEKCRTWLRLSHLFEQLDFHLLRHEEWHARAAMSALLDIANVLARADIKSELLKEFDRYKQSFSRMADSPGVDEARLQQILDNLQRACGGIRDVKGQLGQALRNNEFLNSIVQRSSIAGGTFDFDLPQYHYWLSQPESERHAQLMAWRQEVSVVHAAIDLLLGMIRNSATPEHQEAANGFFQKSLSGNTSAQLVRVGIANTSGVFPEISGSKHRFSIRFLDVADLQHPAQVERPVAFTLITCLI